MSAARRSWFAAALMGAAAVAAIVMTLATHHGLATSSDSARYVWNARRFLSSTPAPDTGEPKHEQAHYPPLYPMVLAGWGKVMGQDALPAARWLQIVIFTINTLLVGVIVRRFGASDVAAIFSSLAFALAPVSIYMHSWLLSEGLFILLSLMAFYFLLRHLEAADVTANRPIALSLIGFAFAASLATLTRYAGVALLPAGVLAMLLLAEGRRARRRVADAVIFAGIFLILPLVNSIYNYRVEGSATNRRIALHLVSLEHIKDAIATFASWAAPLSVRSTRPAANSHPLLAIAGLLLFALVFIAGCIIAWRRRGSNLGRLAGAWAIYLVCFIGMLAISISLVDFHTPADQRVLSPMFAGWIILVACVISAATAHRPAGIRAGAWIACALAGCVIASPSIRLVTRLYHQGDGFAHAIWRNSPTLAAIRKLPADQEIFTNAPGAVYLLTGREMILTVPAPTSASSLEPNPDYEPLMARITHDMRAGRGVLVYLRRYGARRAYYPTEAELKRQMGLRLRSNFADGAVYDLPVDPEKN